MNRNDKNKQPGQNRKNWNTILIFLIISITATVVFQLMLSFVSSSATEKIKYSEFLDMLDSGQIERVEVYADRLLIYHEAERAELGTRDEPVYKKIYYAGAVWDPLLTERLREAGVDFDTPVQNNSKLLNIFLNWVLPVVLIYGIFMLFMRSMAKRMGGGGSGGFMSFGKSTAKVYIEKKTGVTFADFAGNEEAKESLEEIIDFLHNPDKYTAIGAKQPKGALLVGPPGTGKTLLAKAVAGEANVAFFSLSGSDFVEMFVGVGASRVRDLFKQANQNAPCIIFIDEVDAIGKSRDSVISGGNDEREQTLNQLLAEMDGFDSSKGVVILAATNRPDVLDKALLRPGRFDRRVIIEKPDMRGREAILAVHAKKVKMDPNVDLSKVALATPGAAGADLANIINEAALTAVKMKRAAVTQADLLDAVEVIIAGKEKKDRILTEKDKRFIAYHEVGHALASALQKNTQPIQKITIVPRTTGSLGHTLQMPEEERFMMTKDEMLDQITVMLAGRAAEEVEFNMSTTGASNDIERATKLARSMVSLYGMSERFGMMGLESIESKYLDGRSVATCSDSTGALIDDEVMNILKERHDVAVALLTKNRLKMTRIAEDLIEKETITGERFMELLNAGEDNHEIDISL